MILCHFWKHIRQFHFPKNLSCILSCSLNYTSDGHSLITCNMSTHIKIFTSYIYDLHIIHHEIVYHHYQLFCLLVGLVLHLFQSSIYFLQDHMFLWFWYLLTGIPSFLYLSIYHSFHCTCNQTISSQLIMSKPVHFSLSDRS